MDCWQKRTGLRAEKAETDWLMQESPKHAILEILLGC